MYQITFGTDGWRAVIAEHFTFANVERVAVGVGQYVKENYHKNGAKVPVLVGYDTRFLADKFAIHTAQTLINMGIPAKVVSRDVPTPVIAFACQTEPTAGAIQLTASHNPGEYCGMKYIPHFAGPATNEITAQILSHIPDTTDGSELLTIDVPRFDPKAPFMKHLKEYIDFERIKKADLRIGVDCLYSTSRGYLNEALVGYTKDLQVLHDWRDPLFGGGTPEPKPEHIQDLAKLVRDQKLDIGLATDGDADRFGCIDNNGDYLSPNRLLALLLRHLIKNRRLTGTLVRTVATTHLLDRLAQMYDLEVIETPVGFKYIGEIMRQKDVLIGGEESGGVSFKGHIPEKDGITANMMIVEMLAYEKRPINQIWDELVKEAGRGFAYLRRDLRLTDSSQKELVAKVLGEPFEKIGNSKVVKIGRQDGLKFYLEDDSWVLFRPSGTEPLVRLYYEATDNQRANELKAAFDHQLEELMSSLGSKVLSLSH